MKLIALSVAFFFLSNVIGASTLKLLYSDRLHIRLLNVHGGNTTDTVLAGKLDDAIAVGFHYKRQMLFWTDVSLEAIMRKSLKGNSKQEIIVSTGLVRPEGLAVDWVTSKIYWTDSHSKLVEVANMDGSQRSVLFWSNLDQPRAIVVDPLHGYIFWSDWGEEAKIVRAGMDGSARKNVITTKIEWPNGLAVDYKDARLYWLDAHNDHGSVASSDLNGNNRKTVVKGALPHPFAITIFGNRVYWTDWTTKSIHSCQKKNGNGKFEVKSEIESLMDLRAFEQERQPEVLNNPCGKKNGGCSHLCLLAPEKRRTCACPTGVALLADNKTCENGPQNFLLVAKRTELRLVSLDTPDHTAVVLPISKIQQAVVIEFDPVEGFVYWTDQNLKLIKRARLDGSDELTVAQAEVKLPEGIAVDWIGRNLYWSDTGTDRIEVCHLNGSSRRVLISENLDEPRAIVVDPGEGYIYWSDWGSHAKIERAWLDGTHRQVLVNSSIEWPNGLAIDYVERKLYWGDAQLDRIEVCNLNGSGRKILLYKDLPHIYGFGLIGKHLYWTDWQRRNLQKIHIDSSASRDIVVELLPDVMGLKVVDMRLKYGANDCQKSNGGCSHLCLYTPVGVKCECPMGLELTKDNKTCVVPEAFLLFTRQDSIRRISIDTSNGDKPIPISGIEDVNAVDFHINDSRVFWTDFKLNKISRAFLNGSMSEVVVDVDIQHPDGLAVDWVAKNLYWTDSFLGRIECAWLDGRYRKTLISKNITEPHSLALDPGKGYMYWTEWGTTAGIYRSNMAGNDIVLLIQNFTYISRPNSLVIDFFEEKIYWAERHYNHILRANTDGSGLEIVVSSRLPHPNCLTQYKDFIYWGDMEEETINRASKETGGNRTRIEGHLGFIMDMKIFHNSRQTGWNSCGDENGKCSHLCLALPDDQYTCGCPNHYTLDTTNKSCISPQLFLLYSGTKEVHRMTITEQDNLDVILPLRIRHQVRAVEYDLTNDMVYWIDGLWTDDRWKGSIMKSFANGSKVDKIISSDKEEFVSPLDIALDPYGKQLYWTDVVANSIKVTSLTTGVTGTVVEVAGSSPRSIALDPKRGLMYWTNFTEKLATIEKARMDGVQERKQPLTEMKRELAEPGNLVADPNGEHIYYIETKKKKIVRLSLKDLTLKDLHVTNLLEPNSLAVYGDYLYWVEKNSEKLMRANKKTGKDQTLVQGNVKEPNYVIVVDKRSFDVNHPCNKNNGGCSHLCLFYEDSAVCSCTKFLMLGNDKKTCEPPPTCDPTQYQCKSGECIHLVWRCDGQPECEDHSDEDNCPTCRPDQFTCENGQCVPRKETCDPTPYCADESDAKCRPCKAGEFTCKNNKCITQEWICDAVDDCDDNSDEDQLMCAHVTTSAPSPTNSSDIKEKIVIVLCSCVAAFVVFCVLFYLFKRSMHKPKGSFGVQYTATRTPSNGSSSFGDTPLPHLFGERPKSYVTSMSIASNPTVSGDVYDRDNITGRSISTVHQSSFAPSLVNPPPSPATDRSHFTSVSEKYCESPSPSTCQLHRQRRPMMPYYTTPASTDIESSVSKYAYQRKQTSSAYSSVSTDDDDDYMDHYPYPYPPPPTICTNYLSEGMQLSDNEDPPPSPNSEICFALEPDPPPPSPVTDNPSVV